MQWHVETLKVLPSKSSEQVIGLEIITITITRSPRGCCKCDSQAGGLDVQAAMLEHAVGRIICHRRFQPRLHRHTTSLASEHITIACVAFNSCFASHTSLPFRISPNHTSQTTTKMPVPMHSVSSEKSTSTPVTAQTSNTGNTSTTSAASATHVEKTEQEKEMERLYEERMEEEYAKREGGA
jgi:arylamine N-acetyltransferase